MTDTNVADAFLNEMVAKAKAANQTIVLPEGEEPRTIEAAGKALELGIAQLILLGDPEKIEALAKEKGADLSKATVIDPKKHPKYDEYAKTVYELRKEKGMTEDGAKEWLDASPINFGTAMIKCGDAAGLVSGAIHSTGDTVRPALQIIKTKPGMKTVSSVFFMVLKDRVLVYGDCAIVPEPTVDDLASIATASAHTARAFGVEPIVAMLSYSTGASGSGAAVDKVREATEKVKATNPDFAIDGPLQYDAAIDPGVGKLKLPDSPVAGQANTFIFPDLNSGNITYKAVQRSANALAVGPVLQGLNAAINDLSRGCKVEDIVYTIAMTGIQAASM